MKISVCVATYGDDSWRELASRAIASANGQAAYDLVRIHEPDGDIASVRNAAAERAGGDWLCFLDADDELDRSFLHHIRRAGSEDAAGTRKMYTPRVSYIIKGHRPQAPKYWPEKPLYEGNWLIIGTVVPRALFLEVGGFESWPHAYEDWHLFAKLWKAGAEVIKVPKAIYYAHVMPHSRNKRLSREELVQWHYDLGRDLFPEHYPPEWLDRHLGNARPVTRRRRRHV